MKVFVSSLISGFEGERAAVKRAIEVFGHQAIMAEDFGARASSPQVACLDGLRAADLVILILGSRYGVKQGSGVSATHEEVLEARNRKRLLLFLDAEAEPDAAQSDLITELSGWEGGLYRESYSSKQDLEAKVTKAIHRLELAQAVAPLDAPGLQGRVHLLLPALERGYRQGGTALQLALAAGPETAVLRPAELESSRLAAEMQKQALFSDHPLFDLSLGVKSRIEEDALMIEQEGRGSQVASVALWPSGDMRITLPIPPPAGGHGSFGVVEEDVAEKLSGAVEYASWLLGRIDPTERISHVALAARLTGEHGGEWRTRAQHAANVGSMSFSMGQEKHEDAVVLTPVVQVRQVLSMDAKRVVEDFLVLLRRRWTA